MQAAGTGCSSARGVKGVGAGCSAVQGNATREERKGGRWAGEEQTQRQRPAGTTGSHGREKHNGKRAHRRCSGHMERRPACSQSSNVRLQLIELGHVPKKSVLCFQRAKLLLRMVTPDPSLLFGWSSLQAVVLVVAIVLPLFILGTGSRRGQCQCRRRTTSRDHHDVPPGPGSAQAAAASPAWGSVGAAGASASGATGSEAGKEGPAYHPRVVQVGSLS